MGTSSRSPSRPERRSRSGCLLVLAAVLAACAAPLPYRPARQPFGATISADVRVDEERLRVEVDAEGYRVERAVVVRNGDTEIAPEALLAPAAPPAGGLSLGIGGGLGGGGGRGSYSVGTGIGFGLGGRGGRGTTVAVFRRAAAGPPPWRLRVTVVGVEPVDIVIDPASPGPR